MPSYFCDVTLLCFFFFVKPGKEIKTIAHTIMLYLEPLVS